MKPIEIIGILAIIVLSYFTFKKTLWNFNNGCPLNNKKSNIYEIIRTLILILVITYTSIETRILLLTVIFIFDLISSIYMYIRNKTVHRGNSKLYEYYITEIKKSILIDFVCLFLFSLIIYYNS